MQAERMQHLVQNEGRNQVPGDALSMGALSPAS
jgi:hypothetical protein